VTNSTTHPHPTFELLDIADAGERLAALAGRRVPESLRSHEAAAVHYVPDQPLKDAIHVALAVGAPLLLTGEPGTGKTQVAYYIAQRFGLLEPKRLFALFVRSTHTAEDLLYSFDAVGYLHAANDPARRGTPINKGEFVTEGPLWQAYRADGPCVVLIDEIDKAPRDFPNDLLNVLDKHEFYCPERGERVSRGNKLPPPVVVITSNSERRLPEPFLRRCVFHHIELTPELVDRAVRAHAQADFPSLGDDLIDAAVSCFHKLRQHDLRKPPATAELLVWLTLLAARPDTRLQELEGRLIDLPALSTLVKDRDDRALLEQVR
jgi:MoxR-like ATPase